jgi:hypothetical protein
MLKNILWYVFQEPNDCKLFDDATKAIDNPDFKWIYSKFAIDIFLPVDLLGSREPIRINPDADNGITLRYLLGCIHDFYKMRTSGAGALGSFVKFYAIHQRDDGYQVLELDDAGAGAVEVPNVTSK